MPIVAPFHADAATGDIMLLSNMHILQFFQRRKVSSWFGSSPPQEDPLQDHIIQPCGLYLREIAEDLLKRHGRTREQYYQNTATSSSRLLPSSRDIHDHYNRDLDEQVEGLADISTVAVYERGALDSGLDAAVARLVPGTMWTNVTPSGARIKAPPTAYAPYVGQTVMKYGDASGRMRYGILEDMDASVQVPFTVSHEESLRPSVPMKGDTSKPMVSFEHIWKVKSLDSKPFQVQGDSGSALLDAHGNLLGLMSTGGMGTSAYAIPINRIFMLLKVRFPVAQSGMA